MPAGFPLSINASPKYTGLLSDLFSVWMNNKFFFFFFFKKKKGVCFLFSHTIANFHLRVLNPKGKKENISSISRDGQGKSPLGFKWILFIVMIFFS
jgi:hypothetical protein